jgi:dihydrofolate reductase
MGKVVTHMTMSLDGFIANPDDTPGEIFDWYQDGEVSVPSANDDITLEVDRASAEVLTELIDGVGALVAGRRLFDITDGWGDRHPMGVPVVVVTHRPVEHPERWPTTTFVGSVEAGIAQAREIAGDLDVTLSSPDIIRQALDLGLVDELWVSLAPVLYGEGIPYFHRLDRGHLMLDDPDVVVQGTRALHLRYAVRR